MLKYAIIIYGWAYLNFLEVLILLKPVTAIDDLCHLGHRTLIFENDNPLDTTKRVHMHFPEDRSTILYDGKLYDWYGREVALDPFIVHIIKPFGYTVSKPYDILNYRDSFLVELRNSQFAIVSLHYRSPNSEDPSYTGGKLRVTGRTLDSTPYLRFAKDTTTYESIDFSAVEESFLSELKRSESYPLAAIGQISGSSQCVFLSSKTYLQLGTSGGYFIHHIVASKATLIDFFANSDGKYTEPPALLSTTMLHDDIVIRDNGDKITAKFANYGYRGNYKASIDRDCLAFCKDNHLYWYKE